MSEQNPAPGISALLDRPIAFQRSFVRLGIGITGALFLSQAIYWGRRANGSDGWFWKTLEQWEEETGMTRREQESARKRLKAAGILEEKRRGVPCRTWYRINFSVLDREIRKAGGVQTSMAESAKLDGTNPPNSDGGIRQSLKGTETTTEITAETHAHTRETLFGEFWQAYPKKVGKDAARRAFDKRKPNKPLLNDMLRAVWRQRRSEQWTRESGRFIPNPATWLNQGRWQDEAPAATANDEYPGTIPRGEFM